MEQILKLVNELNTIEKKLQNREEISAKII